MPFRRLKLLLIFFCLLSVLISSGCGGIQIRSIITPSMTVELTNPLSLPLQTATEEIIWFPPTETPRPLSTPTVYATLAMTPNLGDLLWEDDFSNEENWQTFRSENGNAVIANHELTLAIQDTESTIISYTTIPWQSDYYLSIDVKLSLCSYNEDAYGILFRVVDSDNYDRLLINCLGQTRVERRYKGEMLPLYDWAVNGKIRPGAPQKFNLGIWVNGSTLRFFVNDAFLYETTDAILTQGGIGVTAKSKGFSPLTVDFSDFKIYEIE